MKQFVLNECVWLLIAAAVYGLLSLLTHTSDPIIIGMIVYSGVRISYLYGLTQSNIKEL
jgi:hypothetical protein